MALRRVFFALLSSLLLMGVVWAVDHPFRQYPGVEYDNFPLPPDYQEQTEWTFARLMYPPVGPRYEGFAFLGDWRLGASNWTMDYPRSDRHFSEALRRLTRVHARSVEQPVNLDDGDDVFNWPWLVAGEMGDWKLTPSQAKSLREYLLRGGFLMLDDFWRDDEWDRFMESMTMVFPDRPIVEIEDADSIFHTVYDLDDRYQILGDWALRRTMNFRSDGTVAHWRGIYDDHGRLMVVICHNMDLGDSWENADEPEYPQKFSALGLRIGINYIVYAMTH